VTVTAMTIRPWGIFTSAVCAAVVAVGHASATETLLVPEPEVAPTITAERPVNPVSSKPEGPVLLSMSVRLGPAPLNMTPKTIIPEFHFVAPHGNAILLHRDLIATSANSIHLNPSTAINIPPEAQKKGAVISGGWTCTNSEYYTTISAYIIDSNGNESNAIKYTVHCNGG